MYFLMHIVDSIPGLAAAVFSTGAASPLDDLSGVELSLRQKQVKGTVLFDFLLVNGPDDRYYLGTFDGTQLVPYRLEPAKGDIAKYNSLSAMVYKRGLAQLDLTLLPHEVRKRVVCGAPV
jgi:hypothetical protein